MGQAEHGAQCGRDIRQVAGLGSSRKASGPDRVAHGHEPDESRLRIAHAVVGESVCPPVIGRDQKYRALSRPLELEELAGEAPDHRVGAAQRFQIVGIVVDVRVLVGFAEPDEQKFGFFFSK